MFIALFVSLINSVEKKTYVALILFGFWFLGECNGEKVLKWFPAITSRWSAPGKSGQQYFQQMSKWKTTSKDFELWLCRRGRWQWCGWSSFVKVKVQSSQFILSNAFVRLYKFCVLWWGTPLASKANFTRDFFLTKNFNHSIKAKFLDYIQKDT